MTILLCTGMDAVGKTTITNNLCQLTGGEYTHFSNPKDMADGKKQYFDFLKNANDSSKLYICDRFHDGEWVYAPIYRNYVANYMQEIEKEISNNHNYLLAYITADLQTIIDRIKVRGEDFVKEEHYQMVLDNFMNNFVMEQKMPFVIVNTTYGNADSNTQIVKDALKKIETIWSSLRGCKNSPTCTGALKPMYLPRGNVNAKYMVVGQNPGGKGKEKPVHNVIFPGGATSEFLINTLKQAGIYLDCWLTNLVLCSTGTNKIDDSLVNGCISNLELQIDLIKPQKIFTLGKETTNYVKKHFPNENIIEVSHPTYVKRFFSKDEKSLENYVNLFKGEN